MEERTYQLKKGEKLLIEAINSDITITVNGKINYKLGDFVTTNRRGYEWISIIKGEVETKLDDEYYTELACLMFKDIDKELNQREYEIVFDESFVMDKDTRYSTPEEIEFFKNALYKLNKRWNSTLNCIQDLNPVPVAVYNPNSKNVEYHDPYSWLINLQW